MNYTLPNKISKKVSSDLSNNKMPIMKTSTNNVYNPLLYEHVENVF